MAGQTTDTHRVKSDELSAREGERESREIRAQGEAREVRVVMSSGEVPDKPSTRRRGGGSGGLARGGGGAGGDLVRPLKVAGSMESG